MNSKYKIFLTVCKTGSFSKTADEMGYSQSAISQSVRNLEDELGSVLLQRKREGLILTKDGESYLPFIKSIVKAEESLEKKKNEMYGLVNETIRIGTFTSVSRNLLPRLLRSFHEKYPSVHFELRQGEYDNIHTWIKEGEVDFAFINPEGFHDIESNVIYHDNMVAVLPKGHRLEKKKVVSLKDLAKEPFILLDEGKRSVPLVAFEKEHLQPQIAYKVYDDYSILAMIDQKMGVSALYGLVVTGMEDSYVIRPIQEPIERTIAVACDSKEVLSASAKKFMDYVIAEVPCILKEVGIVK